MKENKEKFIDVEAEKKSFEEFAKNADTFKPFDEVPEDISYSDEVTNITSFRRKGQTFTRFQPEFRLNASTNLVEVVGEIDVHDLIQSAYDSTLDKILDSYLNESKDIKPIMLDGADKVVCNFEKLQRKIDQFTALSEEAEELRKVFKLSDEIPFDEVFKTVSELKAKSEKDISAYSKAVKDIREFEKKKKLKEKELPNETI